MEIKDDWSNSSSGCKEGIMDRRMMGLEGENWVVGTEIRAVRSGSVGGGRKDGAWKEWQL